MKNFTQLFERECIDISLQDIEQLRHVRGQVESLKKELNQLKYSYAMLHSRDDTDSELKVCDNDDISNSFISGPGPKHQSRVSRSSSDTRSRTRSRFTSKESLSSMSSVGCIEMYDIGTKVHIYSQSEKCWFPGEIRALFDDENGEWVQVSYSVGNKVRGKQVLKDSIQIQLFGQPLPDNVVDELDEDFSEPSTDSVIFNMAYDKQREGSMQFVDFNINEREKKRGKRVQ
eukprot:UN33031